MRPVFVVVEALDGVGKTTLVERLASQPDWVAMDTPGQALRPYREAILAGLGDHQEARALFYAATVLAMGRRARAHTHQGRSVVMDRYWLSTVAYAAARGAEDVFAELSALVPKPDLTVWLTLDEATRVQRMRGRGMTTADRETLDPQFAHEVAERFAEPGRLAPDLVLDTTGMTPKEVVDALLDYLPGRPA
jgi:dTMP kinase